MNNKRAFTLAEVLVTLGVVGVVAALTMPTLVNNTQNKQLAAAFQKANSVVNQAFLMMVQEKNGIYPNTSIGGRKFKEMYMPYLKTTRDCGFGTEVTACILNTAYDTTKTLASTYKNFTKSANINENLLDDGQFVTPDGMTFFIENCCNGGVVYISVDVNGFGKRPNAWGHDLFTWQLDTNGNIVPMGAAGTVYPETTYCSKTSTSNINGLGCTSKAISDPEHFKNLPK